MSEWRAVAAILLGLLWAAGPASAAPARIAFDAGNGIDVMNADGSGRVRLLRPRVNSVAMQPTWSPDGSRIAYAAGPDPELTRIWTMRADGTDRHPLTPAPRTEFSFDGSPAWSPDGSQIAFARTVGRARGVTLSIAIVPASGGAARTVVAYRGRGVGLVESPAWSPDGRRLLFWRASFDRDNYLKPTLHSVGADGSGRRLVARDAMGGSFSPDGAQIAFSSVRDRHGHSCTEEGICAYRAELYAADPDGSHAHRLTNTAGDEQAPAWSADGRRIAFHSDRNLPSAERPEVYSIAPDGSCMTWLTNGTPDSSHPAWEPGADSVSDPGACGDAGRTPLVGTPLGQLGVGRPGNNYWLGTETRGHLLLSEAFGNQSAVVLDYRDCSSYAPSVCGRPTGFIASPVCEEQSILFRHLARSPLFVYHGGLVVPAIEGIGTLVVAGSTTMIFDRNQRPGIRRLVQEIRPISAGLDAAPPAKLPRAALPRGFWHRVRPVESVYRRTHSVRATARALGLSTRAVRERLTIARRLRKLGPFGRARC